MGFPISLMALDFELGPCREIVLAGPREAADLQAMHRAFYERFLPRSVLACHPEEGEARDRAEALMPFIAEQTAREGRPTAYVCRDYACREPVTDPEAFAELLDERG